jgi:hypothetical protein
MVIVRGDRADAAPRDEAGSPKNGRPELLNGMIALSLAQGAQARANRGEFQNCRRDDSGSAGC